MGLLKAGGSLFGRIYNTDAIIWGSVFGVATLSVILCYVMFCYSKKTSYHVWFVGSVRVHADLGV